jgi:O-antigen/teichoic acid export membrane protein
LGTTGVLSVGLALVAAVGAIPAAHALAEGNGTVLLFLLIGVLLLPLNLGIQLLSSAAIGVSQWKMQARHRTVPAIVSAIATLALFVLHDLTVFSAAVVFTTGGLLSALPLMPLLREARPLRFTRGLARDSLAFGARAWVSNLGALTNARLDQLLMIPLVSASQLGLYAVAVTYSGLPTVLTSAMMTVIGPRVAAGDHALIGRSLRITIALMSVAGLCFSLLAPVVIPLAFGNEFRGAVEMTWLLLLAGVPLAGTVLLTAAMTSVGKPGTPALAQLLAGVITVGGLFILLPTMQALGAALVSLVAYSVAFAFMLAATTRHLGLSLIQLLAPTRADAYWAIRMLRSVQARATRARRSRTNGDQ